MQSKAQIDQVLRQKKRDKRNSRRGCDGRRRPTKSSIRARTAKRDLSKDDAMTADSVFWIASMTKAVTGRRRHAAGRAGQALAGGADRHRAAGSGVAPGVRRF